MNFPFKFNFFGGTTQRVASLEEQKLLVAIRYEVMPTSSGNAKSSIALPPNSTVSVSCSPSRGVEFGKKTCENLISKGHEVVPHFAARHVNGPAHAKELAEWVSKHGIKEVFIIGGDVDTPKHYKEALPFMKDFLSSKPGIKTVGFAVYPDGHPTIAPEELFQAALKKQALLADHGVQGRASTQICFNPSRTIEWVEEARKAGFSTPIQLGLPGVVEKSKLMSLCLRLGITESLRFLHKNTSSVMTLLAPGGYDPSTLLADIAPRARELDITGIHCFTFNSTVNTVKWVRSMMGDTSSDY